MARNDHKVLRDPLLCGILLDTLTRAQLDALGAALYVDADVGKQIAERTENALSFLEYQSRMPNWFAEATKDFGEEAGGLVFSSPYTSRVVEIRPYWSLGRTELVQSFEGKPVNWPLWVGDKEIAFDNGKALANDEVLQAILEQAGLEPESARLYSTRLARDRSTMLVGSKDGFISKRERGALNAFLANMARTSIDALAAFLFPPEGAFAMQRSGLGAGSEVAADPVAVINVEVLGANRIRLTLGWLDLREKAVEKILVQIGGGAPAEATDVIWLDQNHVELACEGFSDQFDISASWAAESRTLNIIARS